MIANRETARSPRFVFFRSEIKDQSALPIDFDFVVPNGMDEVTLLITAYAVTATSSSYKLMQRPGKIDVWGTYPAGYATGNVLVAATTAQVLIRTYVATDLFRVHIDPTEAGDSQQYQVNALFTRRNPDLRD